MTGGDDEGPSIGCDLPLGRPGLTVNNELVLSGWATSPHGIAGVAVQIGERQWNAAYGFDTPAIGRRQPEVPGGERAGYELKIDTSRWPAGAHYVTVAAFDREGGRTAIEGSVDVLPFEPSPVPDGDLARLGPDEIAMSLDEPVARPGRADDDSVEISGWAYAEDGIEAVLVTVDGRYQHEALRPIVRPDLVRAHGIAVAIQAGFVTRLDPIQCHPGRHTISVVAIGRDGRTAGVDRELVTPLEPPPEAIDLDARGSRETTEHWEQRALLAEADAAVSRTECDLARAEQERTAWELRRLKTRELARRGRTDP